MLDAILNASGYFYAACVFGAILYGIVAFFREHDTIPQGEIDAEARRLIVEHGAGAITEAEGLVQRSRWAKGTNDSIERYGRVLKAVRRSLQDTQ